MKEMNTTELGVMLICGGSGLFGGGALGIALGAVPVDKFYAVATIWIISVVIGCALLLQDS